MKPREIIWISAVFMNCILIAGIVGCKEKDANIAKSTSTSSEHTEFLTESAVIAEDDFVLEDYSEQTINKWPQEDEQEPEDETNMPDEDPNDTPNIIDIVPIEFLQ